MFKSINVNNFGRHAQYNWEDHGQINLIIGENDTGKTQLLKLLYTISKSIEGFSKRKNTTGEPWSELLANKLMWTFQPDNFELGKLVSRGEGKKTAVECCLSGEDLYFKFGQGTSKVIKECTTLSNAIDDVSSIYIPPKEVFSAMDAIYATRKQLEIPGFDDTYIDLIDALRLPTTQGNIAKNLSSTLRHLKAATGGGEVKLEKGEFTFSLGREKYGMRSIAEGIKKISVLSQLIKNRTLTKGTVLFIDEPETNLHPRVVIILVEMLYLIAKSGVQIYLATHSEFLIKRFEQLVRENNESSFVKILSITHALNRKLIYSNTDIYDGIPNNPILEQSINLYHKDVELDLS